MKHFSTRLALVALSLLTGSFGASAQIVKNGSFDDGNMYWSGTTNSNGKVTLSNVQYWLPGFAASPDDVGRGADKQALYHAFYLNSDPYNQPIAGGYRTISQDISGLVIGQSYQLSFYQAASNQMDAPESATLQWGVDVGDLQLLSAPTIAAPAPHAFTDWQKVSINFVADASSATLKFLAMASAPVAPEPQLLLDGVSITAVPEPGQWSLLLAGAGALAWIVRRRGAR